MTDMESLTMDAVGKLDAYGKLGSWSPLSLFASSEVGAWYDPSDLTTLFQDDAGTTPVTAVEQPVGKMLDKSGRGNHATQSTSANRPTLSARYNQFVGTETLATQNVPTVATTYTLRFEGTGSITLSGTKTGTYSAGTHSLTGVTAGTLTATVTGTVSKADLRVANDGVGIPAYQRVNTATDYDTVGFPTYLRFNGSSSAMMTNTITPGTDKAQVFAGVRKLSDAAQAVVAELSATIASNNGSLLLSAPNSAAANFNFSSKGTVLADNTVAGNSAPKTAVLSGLGSISGDSNDIKINGGTATSVTTDQGTGNYLAYPLYIGARAGTSLWLNGRLYSMIVRFGSNLTTAQITNTEKYVNSKTKAY